MRLQVSNIGKISRAEIDMQGLTVIVGNNSTGKSTISKSLYAIIQGFHNFTEKISIKKREVLIRELRKWIKSLSMELRVLDNKYRHKSKYLENISIVRNYIESFNRFNDRPSLVFKSDGSKQEEFNYFEWMESEENFREKIIEVFSLNELQNVLTQIDEEPLIQNKLDKIDRLYEEIKKETEEEKISREILNEILKRCFANGFSTQFNDNATEIRLYPLDENEEHCARIFRKKNAEYISGFSYMDFDENIVYIQPMHILDDNGSLRFLFWDSKSEKIQDRLLTQLKIEDDFKNIEESEECNKLIKQIDDILSIHDSEFDNEPIGSAQMEEAPFADTKFTYKDDQLNNAIDFIDVASGIKNVTVLKRLVANGILHKGSLLIIDEPEVNLHPDWQMKFAEILVMLRKVLHIQVLINTHSPYFMRAIECYSDLYGIFDDLNIYRTVKDSSTRYQYTVENVSEIENGVEYLYYQMSRPFAKLQEMLEEKRNKEVESDE